MLSQIIFIIILLLTIAILSYSFWRIISYMKLLKPFPIKNIGKRIIITLKVVVGQTKILKRPVIGLMHALVLWGFIFILVGSIEMIIDGIFGLERSLSFLGIFYDFLISVGDISALIIGIIVVMFLVRRLFMNVKRFSGIEMKHKSHLDAIVALALILILMISLLGINTFYYASSTEIEGFYPISSFLARFFSNFDTKTLIILLKINWWVHIIGIFVFANILPYSKHFHVFMSAPNVFLSRLKPLGTMDTMHEITDEIKAMLNPDTAFEEPEGELDELQRFGVLDVEDATWKNYLDSLACTQCGRCTSVCPANLTGKKLSPRKIMIDFRERMKRKAPKLLKEGKDFSDNKSFIRDFISEEEIWACTTCNACAEECPININQPSLILDMRRYLVMEESKAPEGLNAIFQNIENNGAPWQVSMEDRMLWAKDIEVPLMSEKIAKNEQPEYLLWVGSAGAIDDRYKKAMQKFVKILNHLKIDYAVLGTEESDSGDIARRSGNEMLFQMQALMNIELLNSYKIKKIITCDPHDYNTLKNEYPELGGKYELTHHTTFLNNLLTQGKIEIDKEKFANKKITYHDPCYLGRLNNEYNAPRNIINNISNNFSELRRNKSNALCCGAGGGQMFKEAEKGDKEIFIERMEEVIEIDATIVVTACPFCMTMLTDGIKYKNKEDKIKNYDIAELIYEVMK